MSTTNKKPQNDKRQDRSDVLSLLTAIRRMYDTYQDVLNSHTQTALMLSITLEAQMLLMKLRVMKERWQYHLPFKEACKVNFKEWSNRIRRMADSLSSSDDSDGGEPISEYCPSKHFLLDLYETLPENTPASDSTRYYEELNTVTFISKQERIRKLITKRWQSLYKQRFSDYVSTKVEERIESKLDFLREQDSDIFEACHDTLQELSEELLLLHRQSKREFKDEQFIRLAERVTRESDYKGSEAKSSAESDVHEWKNKTPKRRLEKTRQEEIETSIKIICDMPNGSKIVDYIGEDYDIKDHFAEFGQFLHKVRCDIDETEVNDLFEQLYRIRYFREDKEKQEQEAREKETVAATESGAKALAAATPQQTVEPQRPKLPSFFSKALVNNAVAMEKYYEILHHCGYYMGRALTRQEEKDEDINYINNWQWNHVRVAFEKLGFIKVGTPKLHFAQYLPTVFTYLKTNNLTKGFQRHGEFKDGFDTYVEEVMNEFAPVVEILKK